MNIDPQALTAIAALVGALAWPVTVLIVLLAFRGLITAWLKVPPSLEQRSIKAKAGGFEIELSAIERIQEKAVQIAQEPDPQKRLAMAKNLLALDKILPEVIDIDIDALAELQKANIPNAKFVNFWKTDDNIRLETYNRLEKMGLVRLENYNEGECVAVLTDLGKTLLHTLSDTHVGIEPMLEIGGKKEK
jgi:hypothetical protein